MRELCEECGFDSDLYNSADTISSQIIVPLVLAAAAEGLEVDAVATRSDATTWSIAEYVDHVRETAFGNRFAIECARKEPGVDLGAAPEPAFADVARPIDFHAALAAAVDEYAAMRDLLQDLSEQEWDLTAIVDGVPHTVGWFARHVLHEGQHHLADIGRIRHRLGHGAPTQTGLIAHLAVSSGGVPKQPIEAARVGPAGVEGDAQADRQHHGRPLQAVCLWGGDVLSNLQAAGHPIAAGNAGENITIDGVDWSTLRPGARIDVGPVSMLVSAHAIPCAKNAQWFSDRDFRRILHDENPGFSRLYAVPLSAGTVAVGDPVTVEA